MQRTGSAAAASAAENNTDMRSVSEFDAATETSSVFDGDGERKKKGVFQRAYRKVRGQGMAG